MALRYVGNGPYCYANSLAMALSAVGDDYDPGYLECLTAVGMGAQEVDTPDGPLYFFSNRSATPDRGIGLALRNLGYSFTHHVHTVDEDPGGMRSWLKLKALLRHGPVVVGPLDMGRLVYDPSHEFLSGTDHYVVVHEMSGDQVNLHDPAGFPYMTMGRADFIHAWRAETISYRAGSYQMWGHFRRTRVPAPDRIFQATDRQIAEDLHRDAGDVTGKAGAQVLYRLARQVLREGVPGELHGFFSHFLFPVASRRCADFARFYEPYDPERARIKLEQARCMGLAHVALMKGDNYGLAQVLIAIANFEQCFVELTIHREVMAA